MLRCKKTSFTGTALTLLWRLPVTLQRETRTFFFFPVRATAVGVLTAGERAGKNTELEIDLEGTAASSALLRGSTHTGRCGTPPNRGDYTKNNGIAEANAGPKIAGLVWNTGFDCLYLDPGEC